MLNYISIPTRWRFFRALLVFVIVISLLTSYIFLKNRPSYSLYRTIFELEIQESRNLIANTPENKYVFFKQLQGAGFNNQAQEILLFHHLALVTSRVYAYQPVVWRPRGSESLVPLSAFMSGVTKNSINAAVFHEACKAEETRHVQIRVNNKSLWEYSKQLLSGDEKCIIVDDWILNWDFLASSALHDIWPTFRDYLANHFLWSDQIRTIASRAHSDLNLRSEPTNNDGDPYIALHLRRGDFEAHCQGLAEGHTGFTTWATLPILQPSIFPPALDSVNVTSVIEHCYPTLERVLAAVDVHARAKPHLRTVHILHDGAWDHPLVYTQLYKVEMALKNANRAKSAGWEGGPMKRVTHSSQLPVRWGEADWAVTVDVELARRAEVFIGNGYSSLSTQVIALRLGADQGRIENIALF